MNSKFSMTLLFITFILIISEKCISATNTPVAMAKLKKEPISKVVVFNTCFNKSNKLSTPDERDGLKIKCFLDEIKSFSLNQCISLAKKLEYSSNSDLLLTECAEQLSYSLPISTLAHFLNQFQYIDNRDSAIWMNIKNRPKKDCLVLSDYMRYPHNKASAKLYCKNSF